MEGEIMAEETIKEVLELTDESFDDKVLKSKTPVVIDCFAHWCGPCKMMAPVIDELASEYKGKVSIYKLNVDKSPKTSEKYEIMSIPTVLYFKDGKLVNKTMGAMPKAMLASHIDKLLE